MSLYPTTTIDSTDKLQTIDELIEALQKMKTQCANYIDVTVEWDGTFTTCNDMLVSLNLQEKILSDGSKMHDIQFNFSENV